MKIEVNMLTVINGQIKEVEIFGEVYELIKKQTQEIIPEITPVFKPKPKVSKMKPKELDRGKIIDKVHHTKIYENIYNEVKPFIESRQDTTKNMVKIIGKYYPNTQLHSRKCISSVYRNYVKRKTGMKIPLRGESTTMYDSSSLSKGKLLGRTMNVAIYEKPLEDVKQGMLKGSPQTTMLNILKGYYPYIHEKSIGKYLSSYRRYIKEKKIGYQQPKQRKTKSVVRRGTHPKPGTVGFSKKYKTWIKPDEEPLVNRALRIVEYGYVTSVKSIVKKTRMKPDRVRATLDYMMQEGKVSRRFDSDEYTYVYTVKY